MRVLGGQNLWMEEFGGTGMMHAQWGRSQSKEWNTCAFFLEKGMFYPILEA